MTVLPRGAKNRRSGRRPGWLLLTALLVLAILASITLVFTNRVELLRLAVVLSLWAAVLAAFVSVIYRRQSQLDAAKARDMKFVYDLQLDREISARREYELSVEAHLRRQLAGEIRAQAADEMAALRTELATLRATLQGLLGTEFGDRPALESDRIAEPILAQPIPMPMPPPPGRVQSSRVTEAPRVPEAAHVTEVAQVAEVAEVTEAPVIRVEAVPAPAENPIIDVKEEPLTPGGSHREDPQRGGYRPPPADAYRGSHRRAEGGSAWAPPPAARPPVPPRTPPVPPVPPVPSPPPTPWRPPETRTRPGRHRSFDEQPAEPAPAGRHWSASSEDQRRSASSEDQRRSASSAGNGAPPGRHRTPQEQAPEPPGEEPRGQHAGGAPVADLMARLRSNGAGDGPRRGGGRRRRDD